MFKKQIETVKRTVRNNKPALVVGAVLGMGVAAYITKDKQFLMVPKDNTYFETTPEALRAVVAGTTLVYETAAGNFQLSTLK